MTVPVPPNPFTSLTLTIPLGTALYRVHSNRLRAVEFNPGYGDPSRFAFFGDPVVPVLYTALHEDAALAETVLHAVPKTGGAVSPADYKGRVCSRITVLREIRLASLVGVGDRALKVDAADICSTPEADYPDTVAWAAAAHAAGFDGLAYPSSKASAREAHVLFGDRVSETDFETDLTYGHIFDDYEGLAWLIKICDSIFVPVEALGP